MGPAFATRLKPCPSFQISRAGVIDLVDLIARGFLPDARSKVMNSASNRR